MTTRGIRKARGQEFVRTRDHVERSSRAARSHTEREFLRRAPEFYGSLQPSVTWGWLMEMENIFLAIRLKERLKVKYATGKLRGPARGWWRSISYEKGKWEAFDMGWEAFRTLVMRKYQLENYVRGLEEEFLSFELQWLSVDVYTREFRKMLHLVRHLVHSASDEVRFYAQGLPEMYRVYVERQGCLDLAVLCAREVELQEVPTYEKAEEAERQRAKRLKEEGVEEDGCPRCGQPCGLIIYCDCLESDCGRCGDWRHTNVKCPESA